MMNAKLLNHINRLPSPPVPVIGNNVAAFTNAMVARKQVNLFDASRRLYRDVFILGIALEDGSGRSFNLQIAKVVNGIHVNQMIHVRT